MTSVAAARLRPVARSARVALLALVLGVALTAGLLAATSSTRANAATRWYTSAPAQAKAYPVLHYGSRGVAVSYVQKRLLMRPTGYYGSATVRVVKGWERRNGMAPDGRVTTGNWRALHVPHQRVAAHRVSSTSSSESAKRAAILRWARAQIGKPYVAGGEGPNVFDCSGLVQYVVKRALHRSIPRISTDQMRYMKPTSHPRAGDFVFVKNGSRSSHSAIYAGNGRWIEAANHRVPVRIGPAWTHSVRYRTIF